MFLQKVFAHAQADQQKKKFEIETKDDQIVICKGKRRYRRQKYPFLHIHCMIYWLLHNEGINSTALE